MRPWPGALARTLRESRRCDRSCLNRYAAEMPSARRRTDARALLLQDPQPDADGSGRDEIDLGRARERNLDQTTRSRARIRLCRALPFPWRVPVTCQP